MKLLDRQGNLVEIPDNQISQALASGQFGIPEGSTIQMREAGKEAPDVYDVSDAADVVEMFKSGYRMETEEEGRQRQLQKVYGGTRGQIAAGLSSAASALSFGATDQIVKAIDPEKARQIKLAREANPDTSTGSGLAAVIGSLLIPGGQAILY
jgi:Rod binding domain-containing protein